MTRTVVFSHGFGVERDDRGLFSDILDALGDVTGIMFDYNEIDEDHKTLTVRPLSEQVETLTGVIEEVRKDEPESLHLIAHSMGCAVAAMACPDGIDSVIMLAAPLEQGSEHSIKYFADRPGSEINLHGVSRLARSDGTTTIVPSQYWKERGAFDPTVLYNQFSLKTKLTLIMARQDNVLVGEQPHGLSDQIKLVALNGDHDFTGQDRQPLVDRVRQILVLAA